MKRRLRPWVIVCIILMIIVLVFGSLYLTYKFLLTAVSKNVDKVTFVVKSGQTSKEIIDNLASENLIRSKYAGYIYAKLNDEIIFQAGEYEINRNMSTPEIMEVLNTGSVIDDSVRITFKEGKRLVDIVLEASERLGFSYDEALAKINDPDYLQELVDSGAYWFLTEDILNEELYYGLEGYLFPDTYFFEEGATIETVVSVMLKTMGDKLEPFREQIESSDWTVHEYLTLASIIEQEAANMDDRKMVSGVFYNRLEAGWSLGSDVTTFYAVNKSFGDALLQVDLDNCDNGYNTNAACKNNIGLSVGPIDSPSLSAIEAAISPTDNDYWYFVADCDMKTYFNVDQGGHNTTIAQLKSEDNWCE